MLLLEIVLRSTIITMPINLIIKKYKRSHYFFINIMFNVKRGNNTCNLNDFFRFRSGYQNKNNFGFFDKKKNSGSVLINTGFS